MTAHRKPPLPHDFYKLGTGHCRWCRQPIFYPPGHKRAGEPDLRRYWHHGEKKGEPECLHLFKTVSDPSYARAQVLARDGAKCHDCGTVVETVMILDKRYCRTVFGAGSILIWCSPGYDNGWGAVDRDRSGIISAGPYIDIVFTERHYWEVDHDFPLWLVDRTKPFEEIIKYWLLDNLISRCLECHKVKTAEEAAARAKGKRIRGETRRKIQGRGFDKRFTKKLGSGQVVSRTQPARMG